MVTEEEIEAVWKKGKQVGNNDSKVWRKDDCGAWIKKSQHGDRESQYGWEIDHIDPNGGDDISNKRPLQWQNNVAKSDGSGKCVVTSKGTDNVEL